jgi:hypothetical protein
MVSFSFRVSGLCCRVMKTEPTESPNLGISAPTLGGEQLWGVPVRALVRFMFRVRRQNTVLIEVIGAEKRNHKPQPTRPKPSPPKPSPDDGWQGR